ncbi:hypothetical protein C4588_06820 [Candidatus Parcubacteria bacterium]|nr:MAG: hypothetical protein C4588_06820 [Candidatus Parcubacteria bacterium]
MIPCDFTKHVLYRYAERFYYQSEENLQERLEKESRTVNKHMKDAFFAAKEDRSFLNDQNLMGYLWEKYGYDKHFRILIKDKVAFVVIREKGRDKVITCFPTSSAFFDRQKYRRSPKKNFK